MNDYWGGMRSRLDVNDDVRHVQFAKFVRDQCSRNLKYVEGPGWFRFDGCRWRAAGGDAPAYQAVTDAAYALLQHAADEPSDRAWALPAVAKMDVNFHRRAIVCEMEKLYDFYVDIDDMDNRPFLLNFKNGTVDLRSGELRDFDPNDLLTQMANVDYVPGADCQRWEKFVAEIFPGKEDLQGYYQRFLGLCITGESKDHLLGVWYGPHGRNGKGTTIRTMAEIFGKDIVHEVDYSMYEGGRSKDVHSEEFACMRGARMLVAQEGEEGGRMNFQRLKKHSGGDPIQGRHLYGKPFTFKPKFTLVLTTNHLPEFSGGGAPLWARTKAVFFGEHFVGDRVDPDLEPTIQGAEAEGVAAWVVEGARRYYADGRLLDVDAVREATEKHRDEVDPLKPLIGELFEYDHGAHVLRSDFNGRLKDWRQANGDDAYKFKPGVVKKYLQSGGVVEERAADGPDKGKWVYTGIRFPEDAPQAEQREREAAVAAGTLVEGVFMGEYESA